jgi:hypothetical protein
LHNVNISGMQSPIVSIHLFINHVCFLLILDEVSLDLKEFDSEREGGSTRNERSGAVITVRELAGDVEFPLGP